jgi:speckle-type POZ protein
VKIKAGGQTFDVHRWMLEGRSPVFKADLSLAPAAGEGAAELRVDMDADVCKALLQFIYTDKLDLYLLRFMNNELPGTNSLDTAGMAKRLLIAADRYKLDDLKKICEMALLPSIRLSSVAATLALAERHRCPDLKNACIQLILSSPGNLKALVETNAFEKMKTDCPSALIDLLMIKQTK